MQPDGRHAVLDAYGNVLGQHNSLASATRQVQDYFTGAPAQQGAQPAPMAGGIGMQPMGGMPTRSTVPGGPAATWGSTPASPGTPVTGQPQMPGVPQVGGYQTSTVPNAGLQAAGQAVGTAPHAIGEQQLGALQAPMHTTAAIASPYTQYGLGGHAGAPTNADLAAGMQFGQAFAAQHPHLQGGALAALAVQQDPYANAQMKTGAALQAAQNGQRAMQKKLQGQ